jgi:hypothetical protein
MAGMNKLLGMLLAGALALLWLAPAPAQEKGRTLYRIELLVFRVTTPPSGEDWSAPPGYRGFNGDPAAAAASAAAGIPPPSVIKIYTPDRYQLGSMAARLRASGLYQPLAHAAWVQTATTWGRHLGIDLADVGINASGLSGSVYLERGTLLHLGLDLRYGTDPVYHLSELRRVKFNEKHYFDHPAFGAIAIVSPVTGSAADDVG